MSTMRTLLLVEDDPGDEALTIRALKLDGIAVRVDVVRDGAEALDYLFRSGVHQDRLAEAMPAVILLDLHLPRISGLEVLSRIRADGRTKLVPVVILTSSDEQRDSLAGYRRGANSYVHKPVHDYVAAVQKVGDYWLEINRQPPDGAPDAAIMAA